MIDDIIKVLCEYCKITQTQFFSNSRKRMHVLARHAFWLFVYNNKRIYGLGVPQLGDMLSRDHTTVLHGKQKFQWLLDAKDVLATDVWAELCTKFPNKQIILRSDDKQFMDHGFNSFKDAPVDESLIIVMNGIPFAIGYYDAAREIVLCGQSAVDVRDDSYKWRYYVV